MKSSHSSQQRKMDTRNSASPGSLLKGQHLSPRLVQAIDSASHFIVDLDGTLLFGKQVAPGALELLNRIRDRFVILSNNSTDTAASMAHFLRGLGITVERDRIILAGEQTIRFVAEQYPGARVHLLGSPVLQRFSRKMGLILVKDDAQLVVLARDRRFDYERLTWAVNQLRLGAKLVVTNPDLYHPGENGSVVPETGSLLRALVAGNATTPDHIIGKPQKTMFMEALRRLGADAARTLMIGDNRTTDELGARELDIRFELVGQEGFLEPNSPEISVSNTV